MRTIDGFIQPPRHQHAVAGQRRPAARRTKTYKTNPPKQRTGITAEKLQMPLIIGGAGLAGIFAGNIVFGQLLVVAYGIAAWIFGIGSRTSFSLALASMCTATFQLVFLGNVGLSQNFAVYTFLLLAVGVITLNRESKKEGGRLYSIRRTNN